MAGQPTNAAVSACPAWCAGQHSQGVVYRPHERLLFESVTAERDITVSVSWWERVDDLPAGEPYVAVFRHDVETTTGIELVPGQAAVLGEVLAGLRPAEVARFARALADGAAALGHGTTDLDDATDAALDEWRALQTQFLAGELDTATFSAAVAALDARQAASRRAVAEGEVSA